MGGPIFTAGDLRVLLERLPLIRRKALLFCLETRMTPEDLVLLRRRNVFLPGLPPIAREIVRSVPAHLHIDLLFWEQVGEAPGITAPVFGLEASLRKVAEGMSFGELQRLYDRMEWIDEDLEVESFKADIASLGKSI